MLSWSHNSPVAAAGSLYANDRSGSDGKAVKLPSVTPASASILARVAPALVGFGGKTQAAGKRAVAVDRFAAAVAEHSLH